MSKTKTSKVAVIAYVKPVIKNIDELMENAKRMQACWDEIQRLYEEIDSMDYPIQFQLSWTKK